ncbi:MAG: type II secretion system F family protein [Pirellulales bacterium]|nr:type II secretion system F family protein [Pirellulales bacterium]
MPTYQFEAMDATGQEIRDVIDAESEAAAQATIRSMGYYVTKISVKKSRADANKGPSNKKKRGFAIGGVGVKQKTMFTRQLSILQDAGLPILRSLKILEQQAPNGRLKYSLMDVCDEIEGGATLSEAMSKAPKAFDRLYVNMIKAGEAGGALEVILRRLAEFMEKSLTLRRKIQGAMMYPVFVVVVAVAILTAIMIFIVPSFIKIFKGFDTELPEMTILLRDMSHWVGNYWYTLPLIPIGIYFFVKLMTMFEYGREGWDLFAIKVPIFGQIVEKTILARSTRTLGTMISSGVPILEALNITRDTCGNAVFERLFIKVTESIREGESIAKPLKEHSVPPFNALSMFWFAFPLLLVGAGLALYKLEWGMMCLGLGVAVGVLLWLMKARSRVVNDLVVNMVDVGEETGELDTMLYKVADTYDEEVAVLTESLQKLMEPLLIIFLGGAVLFIVAALFLPLVKLIETLSSSGGKKKK